jgi:PTS system fructose-specific IIC component
MPLLHDPDPLLTLAVVVLAGVASGALARWIRLPGITGQILAGIAMGSSVLHVFDHEAIERLQPLTHFALGLMAVTVGSHLSLRRLRGAGRRLAWLLAAEAVVTPALVFAGTWALPGIEWPTALLLGTLAVSTAPVTVVALVKETRSKGIFVKTLVAAVALNNIACIVLFELARAIARWELDPSGDHDLWNGFLSPGKQVLIALALGAAAALFLALVGRVVKRADMHTTASAAAILLTSGMSEYLQVSPLLSCLFLGMIQTNTLASRDKLADAVFENFEPAILATFFTLAGLHLSFEQMGQAGLAAVAFFALRAAGKALAVRVSMKMAEATEKIRRYLGPALLPQAGIAIGLVILLQDDAAFQAVPGLLDLFVAVVLTVVTLNEIVGPLATRWALRKAGEYGMDRTRLIDFLQEENISTELAAATKEEAIERLVDLMIASHHLEGIDRDELLESVLAREAQATTCFGGGLAVPHCILPDGHPMVGVMGLSKRGLTLPTPDGRPVHCMVLLGTSRQERDRHLQVLAALAKTVGTDLAFQERLFNARNPAHAYELLHGEESEHFNTFLED